MKKSAAQLFGVTSEDIVARGNVEQQIQRCGHFVRARVVPCRLQESVTCGLVALCSAADYLTPHHGLSCSGLLNEAKKRGFSQHGEMFNAHHLAHLARDYFALEAHVLDAWSMADITKHVSQGGLILVPYDCDQNHTPALFGGEKSHWCVVCGYSVQCNQQNNKEEKVVFFSPQESWPQEEGEGEVVVDFVCVQPKSKRMGLWSADMMMKSNDNLIKCDNKGHTDLTNLKNKVILVSAPPKNR